MLRSSDWNAHLPEVPPAGEDPPPDNGIPHPLYGDELTAEQLYQMQVNNWIEQQGAANKAAAANNVEGPQNVEVEFQPNWGEWPP